MNMFPYFKKRFFRFFSSKAALYFVKNKRGIIVLMYHSIPSETDTNYPYIVNRDIFHKQIEFLSKYYYPISLTECVSYLKNKIPVSDKPFVVITFDDGYKNNKTNAYPILKKHAFPFTLFASTDYITSKNETFCNWDDIIELSQDPIVTIGSHCVSHHSLPALCKKDREYEIMHSKEKIETIINRSIEYFSFPGGSTDDFSVSIIKKVYAAALIDRIRSTAFSLYNLPRISIDKSVCRDSYFLSLLVSSKYLNNKDFNG